MHVQFAYAAPGRASDGEASIGKAAYAAWPANSATVVDGRAARFAPIFALLIEDNESRGFPRVELYARATPSSAAVEGVSLCDMSARRFAVPRDGEILSGAWPDGRPAPEIAAKTLAGDGAGAGRVVDSSLCAGRRSVFGRAVAAGLGKHQEAAGFAKVGEGRLRARARLCSIALQLECDRQRGAIALHDVRDRMRAVLDAVKM